MKRIHYTLHTTTRLFPSIPTCNAGGSAVLWILLDDSFVLSNFLGVTDRVNVGEYYDTVYSVLILFLITHVSPALAHFATWIKLKQGYYCITFRPYYFPVNY